MKAMKAMKPDAVIKVRFLTTEEGGRESAIEGERYGCPIMVDGHGFDCRFVLTGATRFDLGETYKIEVKFLNSESAMNELEIGTMISLWEGKTIAEGKILTLLSAS